MYNKLAIAIIKPALGTIRDCLSRGIRYLYTRGSNKEFYYNARTLEKNYLGINFLFNLGNSICILNGKAKKSF